MEDNQIINLYFDRSEQAIKETDTKYWARFTAAFCSGIPAYEPVDFTGHGLIVSVMLGAKPTYAVANPCYNS